MKIIYLHGFNSDGNGSTAKALKSHYGNQIITPSYNYIDASKGHALIDKLIKSIISTDLVRKIIPTEDVLILGTSLGGFWANYFSEKYDLECILINPTLTPAESLKKYIGKVKNFSNGKEYNFTEQNAVGYSAYEVGESSNVFKTVFLGAKDKVIDPIIAAKHFKNHNVIIDQDEEHRIKDVSKIIKLIDEVSNSFTDSLTDEMNDKQPLHEHVINAPAQDRKTKEQYADVVWDMLQKSYAKIGGIRGNGFNSKQEMIDKIPFWKLIKKGEKIVAFRLYKDKLGRKSVAGGTDGTLEGRKAFEMITKEDLEQERSYGEISGAVLGLTIRKFPDLAKYCKTYEEVKNICDDEIRRPQADDPELIKHPELKDYLYQRLLAGHWTTKLMVGDIGNTI